MKKLLLIPVLYLSIGISHAQLVFTRDNSIPVVDNNILLKMAWAGGQNFCQFSDIDLNFDGKKDLFVFDRSGNKFSTYINNGIPNTVNYSFSDQYENKFPAMSGWALLLDYNCDDKEDLFTYAVPIAGIRVWRNTSTAGNLQFTLQTNFIKSNYNPSVSNLYVTQVDIPAIEDVDGDGDLDVLTYDYTGTIVEFHKNLSADSGYACDSLIFQLDANGCWGNFSENASNCTINLNQSCRMSFPHEAPPMYEVTNEVHSGSCSLCLDIDADGDKDLIVGDISCCNMTLLTNGGTLSSANMTASEDSFPAGTQFIQQTIFPCGYAVDVNNDGKRDLLVSPNQTGSSFNKESIWHYENTNTDNAPVFSYVKNNFLQDEMIDVGEGAYPVLFDYTGDGLHDLLIANTKLASDTDSCVIAAKYQIHTFKNIGATGSAFFESDTNDFAGLSAQLPGLHDFYPTFGDLDNDGDDDMMIGDFQGNLFYFTNTAGAGNPCNFTLTQSGVPDNFSNPIDVGLNATPQLIDVNRDGRLDLIIGERGGNLNYYRNTGSPASYAFTYETDSFGKVQVKSIVSYGYSVPDMVDYQGNYQLFVGSYWGTIFNYNNIDGNLSGAFTLVDSSIGNIIEGERTAVTIQDMDDDLIPDMIIGNFRGGVSLWKGGDTSLTTANQEEAIAPSFSVYPNPSQGEFLIHNSEQKILSIEVYDVLGNQLQRKIFNSKSALLDLTTFKDGIYVYQVITAKGSSTGKLSIVRP